MNNAKTKLDPLPAAAFQILLALADGDLHGYAIVRQVASRPADVFVLGGEHRMVPIQTLLEGIWSSRLMGPRTSKYARSAAPITG
jgi:hypothetical protein